MDDKNKDLNERWAEPGVVPERGYVAGEAPADRRTAEIRSEIEQTRADMTETIDAIQDKLRPANIAAQATDSVKQATVGKVKQMASSARQRFAGEARAWDNGGSGVMDRIRENPIPVAIAAASIAWIAFGGNRGRRRGMSPAIYGSTRDGEAYVSETVISEDLGDVDMTGYHAEYDGGRASADATGRARAMVRGTGDRLRRATSATQNGLQRFVTENPVAAGAIAAAVGATVGLSLPETRRENELMGEARDTVVGRAQEVARGAAERVQDAAQRIGDVAGDAARSIKTEE